MKPETSYDLKRTCSLEASRATILNADLPFIGAEKSSALISSDAKQLLWYPSRIWDLALNF